MKPNTLKVFCLALATLLLMTSPLRMRAQKGTGNHDQQIKELVTRYYEQNRFNGIVMVAKDGKSLFSEGFGMANMEWNVPITLQTKFLLASVSKTFTATLVMKLIDQGKLTLDTRLSDILTWYRKDVGEKVTIRHLLNHTSGIPNYMDMKVHSVDEINREFGTLVIDKHQFASKYCTSDLEFEPGTQWNYNNSAYFLLGLIIEKLNGKSLETSYKEMIFDPLHMDNSGDIQPDPERMVPNLASGYIKKGGAYNRMPYWNLSSAYAAGTLYSTVDDLLKYD
ncbi:MAG TPA: serine hydrolase domain-containing protein, partial [Prolixibacteraceae bacterium]|nr:serine hydrolase domain-containing protein [Prolixibacteraceae bacterium]